MSVCSYQGCDEPVRCKALCALHYDRSIRGRSLDAPRRPSQKSLLESYSVEPSGCWRWTGSMAGYGYGRWVKNGRSQVAHRAVYEALVGPVPQGLDLDHMCHNADEACPGGIGCPHRACVNPAHLDPATRRLNLSRGRVRWFAKGKNSFDEHAEVSP